MTNKETIQKSENPHEGHRERMRGKIENGFIGSFTDVELLEVLLFYVIKRSNTNVTAHNLLDKFGTLRDVLSADSELLKNVDGIGETSAVFFKILSEINRRIASSSGTVEKRFSSIEQIGEYFIKKFKFITEEKVMLLLLDNKNAVIDCKTIENGTVSSSVLSIRDIAKEALLANAARVVIAHNHPSGDPSPSDDDIIVTRMLRRTLGELDLDFVEHIIVADDRYMPVISYMTRISELDYGN
ncbi:MAG: DNA repair protein RadC [Ruminococcaceae bacterium]|nr:DNA repair protein RadC [Oscillospiraceae bacterium]